MTYLSLAALVAPASAHHPDGISDDWFIHQRNQDGSRCCDLSHVHILDDEDWKISNAQYQVWVGGQWHVIEDRQLLKPAQPNPTGKAILWITHPQSHPNAPDFYNICFTPSHES